MTPHLTPAGRWALLASASLILAGAVATRWSILLLGEAIAVAMTVVYYLQVRSLWAIERGLLRLAVRPGPGRSAANGVVDQPLTLEIELSNRSGVYFAYVRLVPEYTDGLAFDPPGLELGPLRPHERLRLPLAVRSGAVGRAMLHGFRLQAKSATGLVTVSDYLPSSLPLKFLPASATGRRALPKTTRRTTDVQRMGAHLLRRRGFGSDFRELRDHHIGDPFRSIAWKATARTGKLMVREFEDEVIANTFVLLDVSPTMRGGTPPRTKLQHTIELTTQLVHGLARSQDRVGLITFDEAVYGHLRTGPARIVQPHLVSHLVGLSAVVDPELTELDDDEVTASLVRYLMVQERLDFRNPVAVEGDVAAEAYDLDLLRHWVSRALRDEEPRLGDACLDAGIVRDQPLSELRRFCQLRGIPLPYRLEARFGAKERGMVAAIERFLAETRESHLVLLFTDFCGLAETREITSALRLMLARKHRVVVVMPFTPSYVDVPQSGADSTGYERSRVLAEVFRLAERRERGRFARAVSALGIPVLATEPRDSMETLLHRLSLGG